MSTSFRHTVPGGADLLEHLSPALRTYTEGGTLRALDCACGGQLKRATLRMLPGAPGAGKEISMKKGITLLAAGLLEPYDGSEDGAKPRIVACLQQRSSGAVVVGEVTVGCVVKKNTELRFGATASTEKLAVVSAARAAGETGACRFRAHGAFWSRCHWHTCHQFLRQRCLLTTQSEHVSETHASCQRTGLVCVHLRIL